MQLLKSFANCVTTFLDGDIEYIYFDVRKVPIVLALLVIRNVRTVEGWSYNLDNPNFQTQNVELRYFPILHTSVQKCNIVKL